MPDILPTPIVSIAVCTYNRERFLPDCLESVARQDADHRLFELVIINNRSTDRTHDICTDFMKRYENSGLRICYAIETAQGLSPARNRAILEAGGAYIAYIDDDAILPADYITAILSLLNERPDTVAAGGPIVPRFTNGAPAWYNPYSAGRLMSQVDFGAEFKILDGDRFPAGCNMIFRRSVFDRIGNFDPELGPTLHNAIVCDEKDVFMRLKSAGHKVYYDPAIRLEHQIDSERLSAEYVRKQSIGLGKSNSLLYRKLGFFPWLRKGITTVLKFGAAVLLAAKYLLTGKPAVAGHLVVYQWRVMLGYWS